MPEFKEPVDMVLKKLDVPITAALLHAGPHRGARAGSSWSAHKMQLLLQQADGQPQGRQPPPPTSTVGPRTWPKEAKGAGFCEAPRGALGHWIKIKDTKIDNYQCVVPTTWNGSPRDTKNQIGAFEASLMNTPMAKPDEPLEILRTIHSFDPCLACSTHVMSPDGRN
jgi:hydrogenase large subunit